MDDLDAAWRFDVMIQERCATRTEPFEWGTAIFNERFPRVHDQNLLRLENGFGEVDARELAAEADRLQRPAGLSHRKLLVPDRAAGERLAPEFKELAWQRARNLVMAHRGERPAEPRHPVQVVDPESIRAARVRDSAHELDRTAGEQITGALELIGEVVESSSLFAVLAGGEAVSWCVLYEEGGIAEIDAVATAVEHRRHGYGRAVVEAATRAALDSGNELVFLIADDEDWPKELYAKVGYEPIGVRYEFTRT
ncbi:MAG TPA: GNAT family N-acetyltransferase [Thermoleophilaceae bacterium]|nr:GNAT family N-acetyltransferase [Thermoleophilaceae bacterium]